MRYESARLADFSSVKTKKVSGGFDFEFFFMVMLLLVIGLVMVLSSSYARAYYDPSKVTGGNAAYYFVRQLIFAVFGTLAMLLASKVPMKVYRRYSPHFMLFTLSGQL